MENGPFLIGKPSINGQFSIPWRTVGHNQRVDLLKIHHIYVGLRQGTNQFMWKHGDLI